MVEKHLREVAERGRTPERAPQRQGETHHQGQRREENVGHRFPFAHQELLTAAVMVSSAEGDEPAERFYKQVGGFFCSAW